MGFVKLTELYMKKGVRERAEGASEYADRDIYEPVLTPIWINAASVLCMRLEDLSYAAKCPDRFPKGRPQTTVLFGKGEMYTVTETPEQIQQMLQPKAREE